MKEKLNLFVSNVNGQFIEVSYREAIYQCMDLAYLWTFVLDIPKSAIQHQYAYEVYTGANETTKGYFDIIKNETETIPQEGDLVIWNKTSSNSAGHIAIVIEATQSKMLVFEQNNPLGTNAHIQERGYTNCLGFLRPKNVIIDGFPQWLKTLLQEINLTIQNESEIRVIFEKAKKYDDEVKTLQEQIKLSNEQLADKSLEVSGLIGKNETLTAKVDELQKLYSDAKSERDTFSWEKDKLAIQVTQLQEKTQELQKGIDDRDSQIKGLKNDLVSLADTSVDGLSSGTLFGIILKRIFRKKVK